MDVCIRVEDVMTFSTGVAVNDSPRLMDRKVSAEIYIGDFGFFETIGRTCDGIGIRSAGNASDKTKGGV
jgi:hypothetical protein